VVALLLAASAPAGSERAGATQAFDLLAAGKLIGSRQTGGGVRFGQAVDVSADGRDAIVGGPGSRGAAWIFARSGSSWRQRAILIGKGAKGKARFGASVALPADRGTLLVGGPGDNGDNGAVWVFTRSRSVLKPGSVWEQQARRPGRPRSASVRALRGSRRSCGHGDGDPSGEHGGGVILLLGLAFKGKTSTPPSCLGPIGWR
jgi:FG-GAP repeat